jgi:hypothetical protein
MGGSSKSEQAHLLAFSHAGNPKRPEANDSGTQQGSRMQMIERGRNGKAKVGAGKNKLGIPAINYVPCVSGEVAKIFHAVTAVRTTTICPANPGNTDPRALSQFLACDHFADDLVTGNDSRLSLRKLSLNDVKISAANAASKDPQKNVPGLRLRDRYIFNA